VSCEDIYYSALQTKKYYNENDIDLLDYEYDMFIAIKLCPELIEEEEEIKEDPLIIIICIAVGAGLCSLVLVICCILKCKRMS